MDTLLTLEFSLDYDGMCEEVETFEVKGEDKIMDITEEDVDLLVKELLKFDEFYTSEDRTEVLINCYDNGKMEINFRYFTEPDDHKFEDYKFEKLTNQSPIIMKMIG